MSKQERTYCFFAILAVSAALYAVGHFWPSFYFQCIGVIVAFAAVVFLAVSLFTPADGNGDNESAALGCCVFGLPVLFSVVYFFNNGTRYISPENNLQHRYETCEVTGNVPMREVSQMEGYFHGAFSDCEKCKERRAVERKAKREAREQEKREAMIEYLQGLIDLLNDGATVGEIEEILMEDFAQEDESFYDPGHV